MLTIDERRKYLKRVWLRYRQADRAGRGALLTEMAQGTGLHRKSLVRLLNGASLERQPRRQQRGRRYGLAVRSVVATVWESLDYLCAERLTPALLPAARHLAQFGECQLTPPLEEQLATISRATVQRMLTTLARPTPACRAKGRTRPTRCARPCRARGAPGACRGSWPS